MKKIGLLVAVLAVVALAAQQQSWYWDVDHWVQDDMGPQGLSHLYTQYPTGGACNKQYYTFNFTTSASMAQWIEFAISGTEYKWRIRKVGPNLCQQEGWYVGDCITWWIKSNYDVDVTFSGFDHLYNPNSVDKWIEVCYLFGQDMTPPDKNDPRWICGPDMDTLDLHFGDSDSLHSGHSFKMWCMIHVTSCNSACEYTNTGTVTLELKCIKPWIDPQTGYFL